MGINLAALTVPQLPAELVFDLAKYALSFGLIVVILIWLAAVYRGSAGDEEIEGEVGLFLMGKDVTNLLTIAPKHLAEKSVHIFKSPKVQFYLQLPDRGRYSMKILERPLKLSIRDRNRENVHDHTFQGCAVNTPGGQVGIDYGTHQALSQYFSVLYTKEGRNLSPDDTRYILKFKYPSRVNLDYLLREHPDPSVKVGAWIFLLTSIFTIVQDAIVSALHRLLLGS